MEPQIVTAFDDGTGHLAQDGPHEILTTINHNVGETLYSTTGGGAYKAVLNTHHPLRSAAFFRMAGGKNDTELCTPMGVQPTSLRNLKVKGYMTSNEADKWSIRIFGLHPAEVWGSEAWIDAAMRKFK